MTQSWSRVTALFGGTFDPPHLGHREAVRGLFQTLGIWRVMIIPSGFAPHKKTEAAVQHRIEMAKLNFQSTPTDPFPTEVYIDWHEVQRAHRYKESVENASDCIPSYTYDTLVEVQALYSPMAFVIGLDQLIQLESWYGFPEIIRLCHWIVLERKNTASSVLPSCDPILQKWIKLGLIQPLSSCPWKINQTQFILQIVPTHAPGISSTMIRESLATTGRVPSGSLLPEVEKYLLKNGLYGIIP